MNDFALRRTWGPKLNIPKVLKYKRPSDKFIIISGPCFVESEEQISTVATFVAKCGATHLRGGVFKAGTFPPKDFGWVDISLIKSFADAAWANGLKNIVEVLDYTNLQKILPFADCLQVGARQTQNYNLLKTLAKFDKPIFLKRNTGMTIDEWLGAAEYLLSEGICEPILVERGTSTLHNDVRWTPTLHTIPSIKSICDLPIIFDASHSTGRRDLVNPMACAGVAAGADGLLIEVHPDPVNSFSDADQALDFYEYEMLINKVKRLRSVIGQHN